MGMFIKQLGGWDRKSLCLHDLCTWGEFIEVLVHPLGAVESYCSGIPVPLGAGRLMENSKMRACPWSSAPKRPHCCYTHGNGPAAWWDLSRSTWLESNYTAVAGEQNLGQGEGGGAIAASFREKSPGR